MSFFEPPPPPPAMPDFPEPDPTGRYVPGVVPLELVLGQNDKAAVVIRSMEVYPDGVSFKVETVVRIPEPEAFGMHTHFGRMRTMLQIRTALRPEVDELTEDGKGGAVSESQPKVEAVATSGFGGVVDMPTPSPFDDAYELSFGVQFPDGTKVTTLRPYVPEVDYGLPGDLDEADEPRYGLEVGGGGGSDSQMTWDYFLWPIPGAGQITIVCAWSHYDLPESSTVLDTQIIREAAARARPLWPEDEGRPTRHNPVAVMRTMHRQARLLREGNDREDQ